MALRSGNLLSLAGPLSSSQSYYGNNLLNNYFINGSSPVSSYGFDDKNKGTWWPGTGTILSVNGIGSDIGIFPQNGSYMSDYERQLLADYYPGISLYRIGYAIFTRKDPDTKEKLSLPSYGLSVLTAVPAFKPIEYLDELGPFFKKLDLQFFGSKIKTNDVTPSGLRFTNHGAERANERGFSSQVIDSIVQNNKKNRVSKVDDLGNKTWEYLDKRGNKVVLNEQSGIVSVHSSAEGGVYIPKIK